MDMPNKLDIQEIAADMVPTLAAESDRGLVLVGAQLLDMALEDLIRAHLTQGREVSNAQRKAIDSPFQGEAPFSTFSAKSKFAFASGIIMEFQFRVIEAIRRIRNEFAHHHEPVTLGARRCRQQICDLLCDSEYMPSRRSVARNVLIRSISIHVGMLMGMCSAQQSMADHRLRQASAQ
jgi:DNA-binding MltR family transcriptional regulator